MESRDSQPIETLRVNDRDKAHLLRSIGQSARPDAETNRRRLRVRCTHNDAVLNLLAESGGVTRFTVLARDLSRWGASVVHGRYTYPGTRCDLELRALDGVWHTCSGEVRHSRHVQGLIHELGVLFDRPIDLSEFATMTPDEEMQHLEELAEDLPADEAQQVTELASRVLIVDDYASDRKLFSHWLSKAGMAVSSVAEGESAKARVDEARFDLLVIDKRLGHESGAELVRTLRSTQFVAPILMVSADNDKPTEDAALAAGANRFLSKPFNAETLVHTARELMGFDAESETTPVYSEFNDDPELRPLLTEFTRGLSGCMDQLREAIARQDYELLDEIARSLKGVGSGYGFAPITEHASGMLDALNDSAADIDKIRYAANDLLCTLNRVKLR